MSNDLLSVREAAKSQDYRRYRLDAVPARDAIARVRSDRAFRMVALECCEEAKRKLARRK